MSDWVFPLPERLLMQYHLLLLRAATNAVFT